MTTSQRTQWLAERRKGIGGSDAAAVLGCSPWATPMDVYLDKIGEAQDKEETDAMRFGTILEPVIREEYLRRTGHEVMHSTAMSFVSDAHPFMRANLDGIAKPKGSAPRVLEIKTARSADGWGDEGTDEVPIQYNAQVQHYMAVTGLMVADIAVLIGGSQFRIYTVEADKELHEALIQREHDFWHGHVLARVPPDPINADDVAKLFAKDNGAAIEAGDEIFAAWDELRDARARAKALAAEIEALELRIKGAMGEAAELRYRGNVLATWKAARDSSRFDAKAFAAAHPELAAQFSKTTPGSRRFLIKEAA